ncbi:ABC-type antimicrobial peptide transport system, permease component, partial [human gut metagenome]
MSEKHWLQDMMHYTSEENAKTLLEQKNRRGNLVSQSALIEGLDDSLFDKLTVVEGDISPLFQDGTNAIAVVVSTDDYGNVSNLDYYPPIGSVQTITYIDEGYYIDSRNGNLCDENTPTEYMQFQLSESHDVDYTVCVYV